MPNILFNCSTNTIGGGVKNSALFVKYTLTLGKLEYYYALSPNVISLLESWRVYIPTSKYKVFNASPSRSYSSRKELYNLVKKWNIIAVYTMAGPAYVDFRVPHIQGISNPYITHGNLQAFWLLSNKNILKLFKNVFTVLYQVFHSKRAQYFVFQTEHARNTFISRTKTDKVKTYVVPNAYDLNMYNKFQNTFKKRKANEMNPIVIFCPGAAYRHKAFQYIPEIAKHLKELTTRRFLFQLTLPQSSLLTEIKNAINNLRVEEVVENLGPFSYSRITEIYQTKDIIFVPSLFETFSASYLEAIVAHKPLVVAKKDFSKDICRDYAFYINPLQPEATALKFKEIIENNISSFDRSTERKNLIARYGNQKERFEKLEQLLIKILNNQT